MSIYKPTQIESYNKYRNVLGEGVLEYLFTCENIALIQKKTTELLRGVLPDGRSLVVTQRVIVAAMDSVIQGYTPQVAAIYSRYTINDEPIVYYARDIIDRTINFIVQSLRNEYDVIKANFDLSIWDTVLGDFNRKGLMPHDKIKIRKNRPDPMQFNMNY
jgi:hypothetical protein